MTKAQAKLIMCNFVAVRMSHCLPFEPAPASFVFIVVFDTVTITRSSTLTVSLEPLSLKQSLMYWIECVFCIIYASREGSGASENALKIACMFFFFTFDSFLVNCTTHGPAL